MAEKVYPTSIRLPEDLKSRLEELAAKEHRSLSNLIIAILYERVEQEEEK